MLKKMDGELKEDLIDIMLELSRQAKRQVWWPFTGVSMLPHITEGDMLLVRHALHPIRLGDVVVFRNSGGPIAHRVVGTRRRGARAVYLTKGDNCRYFDEPVPDQSILGRVICIQKGGRRIDLGKPSIKTRNFLIALSSSARGYFYGFARGVFLWLKSLRQ